MYIFRKIYNHVYLPGRRLEFSEPLRFPLPCSSWSYCLSKFIKSSSLQGLFSICPLERGKCRLGNIQIPCNAISYILFRSFVSKTFLYKILSKTLLNDWEYCSKNENQFINKGKSDPKQGKIISRGTEELAPYLANNWGIVSNAKLRLLNIQDFKIYILSNQTFKILRFISCQNF